MTVLTQQEYEQEEQWQTQWESNRDDAKQAFYEKTDAILLKFQHHIDADTEVVHVTNVREVSAGIIALQELTYFSYDIEVEGKYRDYTETLEYNFSEELAEIFEDELGVEYKKWTVAFGHGEFL